MRDSVKHSVQKPLPELLAPAGSADSLRAALAAGADAVYFGGTSFSNRMRAKNFGDSELSDAIRLCHSVGAAAHITVNTRVRDRETDDILRLADTLLENPDTAPDALIVADFGVAREIHRRYPDAVLHASTQTSLSSPADCRMLAEMGFSRLVIPRELSCAEIRRLCESTTLEIEMFVHGAHCVSCSGQCLLSFMMGGRSGNRGECAQPCRLPFEVTRTDGVQAPANSAKKHPENRNSAQKNGVLSLADMCLAGQIPDVIDTGVRSLKIEGRLKSAAYVYGTTKIYRTLLDERRPAEEGEIRELASLFSRGFTDGYFTQKYAKMTSLQVSGDTDKAADRTSEIGKALNERIRAVSEKNSVPLTAVFRLHNGEPTHFALSRKDHPGVTASADGELPQTATGAPLTAESAAKNLTKFGGTGYTLSAEDISFEIGENLWYPVSALNDLRRRALAALEKAGLPAEPAKDVRKPSAEQEILRNEAGLSAGNPQKKQLRTAEVTDIRTLFDPPVSAEFSGYFDRIYVPAHSYAEAAEKAKPLPMPELAAVFPVYTPSDEAAESLLASLKKSGCARVMCHTVGQVFLAKKHGFSADMSFRANITNTAACTEYRRIGCESIVLSPEIPPAAVEKIGGGAIVYGHLPLMTLARCVICGGKCPLGNRGGRTCAEETSAVTETALTKKPRKVPCTAVLRDRKGEEFPVIGTPAYDCVNVVYNSVPTWMGDRSESLRHIPHLHFMFTTETSAEADDVVRAYIEKRPCTRGRRL